MNPYVQTYVIYALLLVIGFVLGRLTARQRPESGQQTRPTSALYSTPLSQLPRPLDHDAEERIVELLRQGKMIEAIKRYREATGSNLKQSKEAVEAIVARRSLDLGGHQ
ncbi:hypothetical protein [Dyella sp.]|uniref:hypothetical protein n=1 Tax=Dyella sp. TaxID=1869338 RepID=UPI002ECFE751